MVKSSFRSSGSKRSPQPGYHPLDLKIQDDTKNNNPNQSSAEMDPSVFKQLQSLPGNDACIDCGANCPDWGSPNLGILFCFHCSGRHRSLGTHLSFVRSIHMDAWTARQVQLMQSSGGNQACNEFLEAHGITNKGRDAIATRYSSPASQLYQQVLVARLDGKPVPTELPPPPTTTGNNQKKKMEGFGSAPLPNNESSFDSTLPVLLCVALPAVAGVVLWWFVPH